jgi:hypothetical protein
VPGREAIGGGTAVAEDAALDSSAHDELLDEHLLVVLPRELDGGPSSDSSCTFADPDRRARGAPA